MNKHLCKTQNTDGVDHKAMSLASIISLSSQLESI